MNIVDFNKILSTYLTSKIETLISDNDGMFIGNVDSYMSVGKTAVISIFNSIICKNTSNINSILDFGCGYGRVGRHIRAMFPDSEITFCDYNDEAIAFCANTFNGKPLKSSSDFKELRFDRKFDLIWVGSVFTHISYQRQKQLFDVLVSGLNKDGCLVATFHGKRCLEIAASGKIKYLIPEKWNRLINNYLIHGHAWESYDRDDLKDWGISINDISTLVDFKHNTLKTKIINLSESAYGNHQDVLAWLYND